MNDVIWYCFFVILAYGPYGPWGLWDCGTVGLWGYRHEHAYTNNTFVHTCTHAYLSWSSVSLIVGVQYMAAHAYLLFCISLVVLAVLVTSACWCRFPLPRDLSQGGSVSIRRAARRRRPPPLCRPARPGWELQAAPGSGGSALARAQRSKHRRTHRHRQEPHTCKTEL